MTKTRFPTNLIDPMENVTMNLDDTLADPWNAISGELTREPRAPPKLRLARKPPSIFDYQYSDFEITGYEPHPHIPAPIAR